MKKRMPLAAAAAIATILIVGALSVLPLHSSRLSTIALQAEDFPPRSELIGEGSITPYDVAQPLSSSNSLVSAQHLGEVETFLYRYQEGYKVERVVWDGRSGAFAGNYLYRYADSRQAQAVAQAIHDFLQARSAPTALEQGRRSGRKVQGWIGASQDDEGGLTCWFVGTRDDLLILLIVDGMPSAKATFETLVATLLTR